MLMQRQDEVVTTCCTKYEHDCLLNAINHCYAKPPFPSEVSLWMRKYSVHKSSLTQN
jgi:hypothetical protein